MIRSSRKKLALIALAVSLALALLITPPPAIDAADHGDSPENTNDRQADLGDVYLFLDPNDNTKVIIAMTTQGFIVPGEAVNFSIFDSNIRYSFQLELTGDAVVDKRIDIGFTPKAGSGSTPQTAIISLPDGSRFNASTTVSNLSGTAPTPVITPDPGNSGIQFFAGAVDDPFFFDIPAFGRFLGSVVAGAPDPSHFTRGRDTFAGYNTMGIALSIPLAYLQANGLGTRTSIGLDAVTTRNVTFRDSRNRPVRFFSQQDRAGVPAVNTVLIPFDRKNEFNKASAADVAANRFTNSILATLQFLGTNATNTGVLAAVAVANGDFLRLDTTKPNAGTGGGGGANANGFPNGRRLRDDVINVLLTLASNGGITTDNVDANDVAFRDQFPFFAPTHQPFAPGTSDDRTRN